MKDSKASPQAWHRSPHGRSAKLASSSGRHLQHLQHEGVLLVVLLLLIVSNMQGVYRESFGNSRDYAFLLMASLWLGKHLVFRWIVTGDSTTVQSPTIVGWWAHMSTTHFIGGQIYDRPTPRQIAKFLYLKEDTVLLQVSLSSFEYGHKLWRRGGGRHMSRLYQRMLERFHPSAPSSLHQSSNDAPATVQPKNVGLPAKPRSKFGRLLADAQQQWESFHQNGPSSQFLLCCFALFLLKSFARRSILDAYEKEPSTTYLYSASLGVSVTQEPEMMKRKGAYKHRELADSWWDGVWRIPVMILMGLTFLLFSRAMLPMPDLIAGNSLVRYEEKLGGGGTTGSAPRGGTLWLRMLAFASPTIQPWSEWHVPISTIPKIDVHAVVLFLRMVDILWIVLWLPRTDGVCQLTGHCPSASDWAERTHYLYPVGITHTERSGRPHRIWPNQVQDDFSFGVVLICLFLWVPLLLLSHALLANRTYWASWGSFARDWDFRESWDGESTISAWDARQVYRKDDLVLHQKEIFKAVVPQSDSEPCSGLYRLLRTFFMQEIGHPVTSAILCSVSGLQVLGFFCHFLLWCNYYLNCVRCDGFLAALIANGLVAYTVSALGQVPLTEIERVNAEVAGQAS